MMLYINQVQEVGLFSLTGMREGFLVFPSVFLAAQNNPFQGHMK